jgi:nicotinate-nucleotide adenylyltransferase
VAEQIGVLGGTFDPVHLGHLRLGMEALEQLRLGRVLFIPAARPWRKAGRSIAPAGDRLAMLKLALEANDAFDLSTGELERAGPTYTVDTLATLQQQFGRSTTLHFIVGADALRDLPNWREPARIAALARIAVTTRAGRPMPSLSALEMRVPGIGERIDVISMPPMGISSTDLRRRVATGRSLRYLVPDAVAAYISEHRLYRGRR